MHFFLTMTHSTINDLLTTKPLGQEVVVYGWKGKFIFVAKSPNHKKDGGRLQASQEGGWRGVPTLQLTWHCRQGRCLDNRP